MTAPGDVVGQAVVNVRKCAKADGFGLPLCIRTNRGLCPGCQGDGRWVDTSNPTMVAPSMVQVFIDNIDGDKELAPVYEFVAPMPDELYPDCWRPVENGDTDE